MFEKVEVLGIEVGRGGPTFSFWRGNIKKEREKDGKPTFRFFVIVLVRDRSRSVSAEKLLRK